MNFSNIFLAKMCIEDFRHFSILKNLPQKIQIIKENFHQKLPHRSNSLLP